MCSSASRWAARAPFAESSSATVRAVAGDRPLASYSAVSSVSSVSGESASSRFSCAICARSLSRWLETETYSPSAIDTAPPTRPASPAVKMGPRADVHRNPDDNRCDRHDPVIGAKHPGPQPVQAARAAPGMRLRGVRRPPALGRLNLSNRGHCIVNTHPSDATPTVRHYSGSVQASWLPASPGPRNGRRDPTKHRTRSDEPSSPIHAGALGCKAYFGDHARVINKRPAARRQRARASRTASRPSANSHSCLSFSRPPGRPTSSRWPGSI